MFRSLLIAGALTAMFIAGASGCNQRQSQDTVTIYCAVDEPYASKLFEEFHQQTGINVAPLYDIESSKSVGLAGKLEAEADHPQADVWWGSEGFLTTRLADEGILDRYDSPAASDILPEFKDSQGYWTGVGLRARVLAVGEPAPPFPIKSLQDLLDPRLKGKIAISVPTAGATGAHVAALSLVWGESKTNDYFRKLYANGVQMLGGNAEVADQVGAGSYLVGLTDSDDVSNTIANGGKLTAVVPDQDGEGTLAMPTTVALVKGAHHDQAARKLIDFLLSKQAEQKLIDLQFAKWSVRGGTNGIKAMKIDYRAAGKLFAGSMRTNMAILQGHG
jgi:iron(III) transport system substrate-binding protein